MHKLPKVCRNQQYTTANKLADFRDMLNNMQMSGVSGKPKPGQGQGMQLPDIIKKTRRSW
jgi:exoribonuclease R